MVHLRIGFNSVVGRPMDHKTESAQQKPLHYQMPCSAMIKQVILMFHVITENVVLGLQMLEAAAFRIW